MKYINFRNFGAKLRKLEEKAPDGIALPEGLSQENFDLIERVLRAEKPGDIEDIPTEVIASLYGFAELYLGIFSPDVLFDEGFYSRLKGRPGIIAKRRIL